MVPITRRQRDLVFKAIADPTRREILSLLTAGRKTVGELAGSFRTSRPAISKHLRSLRGAGLVSTRKQGTASLCELNGKPLRAVNEWLQRYEAFWDENLRNLKRHIEENP
jgi:DNA-binding transcriptional ArsR family regulator